jgi:hypothetical protein
MTPRTSHDDSKKMRTHPFVVAVVSAALGAGCFVASAAATSATLEVSGNGLSDVHLGTAETRTVTVLTRMFGHPNSKLSSTPGLRLCDVSATIGWSSMGVYFNHNRLVGLSFGPGHSPSVVTVAGLKLGDTLARARDLYAKELSTSTSQGGAWFVSTPVGRIDGFLKPSTGRAPTPSAKIWTIDVGVVGCPAESP